MRKAPNSFEFTRVQDTVDTVSRTSARRFWAPRGFFYIQRIIYYPTFRHPSVWSSQNWIKKVYFYFFYLLVFKRFAGGGECCQRGLHRRIQAAVEPCDCRRCGWYRCRQHKSCLIHYVDSSCSCTPPAAPATGVAAGQGTNYDASPEEGCS